MVATAHFLFFKERNQGCAAPSYGDWKDPSSYVDVAKRFTDILKIWWSYAVIDFIRSVIALVAVAAKSRFIAAIY